LGRSGIRGARLKRSALAALVGVAFLVGGGGRADAAERDSDPATSATLTTLVAHDVSVRHGQTAVIGYLAEDTAGDTVTVDLVVTTTDGKVVLTLVKAQATPVGLGQVWRGRIRLAIGRYLIVAHARDANGLTEARATTATLTVLKALPPAMPSEAARRAAFAWAARRAGRVSVAVIDSRGRLFGLDQRAPFVSASVVKAMLLVAYLRDHATVSPVMKGVLTRMIEYSDNAAADLVYYSVGRTGLKGLAHVAGMRDFQATGAWITTHVTAADMALFFRDMEKWVPERHRSFANRLLSHVSPYQSWGIPAAAVPLGFHVFFKPGWLGAWVLASEAARLERGGARLGLAVFTDGNPTSSYGKETIAGVTQRLLQR
jgi:hypothetical protein